MAEAELREACDTLWPDIETSAKSWSIAVDERVIRDDALIIAGGVTSGIDFGLAVVTELMGQDEAEIIQLSLEYAPAPPFDADVPGRAVKETLAAVRQRMARSREEREALLARRRKKRKILLRPFAAITVADFSVVRSSPAFAGATAKRNPPAGRVRMVPTLQGCKEG